MSQIRTGQRSRRRNQGRKNIGQILNVIARPRRIAATSRCDSDSAIAAKIIAMRYGCTLPERRASTTYASMYAHDAAIAVGANRRRAARAARVTAVIAEAHAPIIQIEPAQYTGTRLSGHSKRYVTGGYR